MSMISEDGKSPEGVDISEDVSEGNMALIQQKGYVKYRIL